MPEHARKEYFLEQKKYPLGEGLLLCVLKDFDRPPALVPISMK